MVGGEGGTGADAATSPSAIAGGSSLLARALTVSTRELDGSSGTAGLGLGVTGIDSAVIANTGAMSGPRREQLDAGRVRPRSSRRGLSAKPPHGRPRTGSDASRSAGAGATPVAVTNTGSIGTSGASATSIRAVHRRRSERGSDTPADGQHRQGGDITVLQTGDIQRPGRLEWHVCQTLGGRYVNRARAVRWQWRRGWKHSVTLGGVRALGDDAIGVNLQAMGRVVAAISIYRSIGRRIVGVRTAAVSIGGGRDNVATGTRDVTGGRGSGVAVLGTTGNGSGELRDAVLASSINLVWQKCLDNLSVASSIRW